MGPPGLNHEGAEIVVVVEIEHQSSTAGINLEHQSSVCPNVRHKQDTSSQTNPGSQLGVLVRPGRAVEDRNTYFGRIFNM